MAHVEPLCPERFGDAAAPQSRPGREERLGGAARELRLDPAAPSTKVKFNSKQQLLDILEQHRYDAIDLSIDDVVDMIAELRGVTRNDVLRMAITAWFYHALGFGVLEAECHEQSRTDDSPGGLLLFRVRLDGDHEQEVSALPPGEELTKRYRSLLIAALPSDLAASKDGSNLDQMISISWTKGGSIELGGVAALNLVVVIVMAIGIGMCRCDFCRCCNGCPCLCRPGHAEAREYSCALRSLRQRGAEFQVDADGSATLRVPPCRDAKWRCPECTVQ